MRAVRTLCGTLRSGAPRRRLADSGAFDVRKAAGHRYRER
jgi:hypothetical protein